jgi:phage-related holin
MNALALFQLIVDFFSTYIFDDWQMINFLLVLIMVDTVTGVYAAWKTSTSGVYSFRLRSIFEKLWYYFVGFIVVHVLTAHLVDGQPNPAMIQVVPYFKGLIYFLMLGAEALSIDENAAMVGRGFLPPWFRKKYNKVKEEGPDAFKEQLIPMPVAEAAPEELEHQPQL